MIQGNTRLIFLEWSKSKRANPDESAKRNMEQLLLVEILLPRMHFFKVKKYVFPFPNAPVNKIPDRLGMTRDPGTLFTLPDTTPESTQTELFTPQKIQKTNRKPFPVDPQVGKLPDDLKPFVTYVPLHLLSAEQKKARNTAVCDNNVFYLPIRKKRLCARNYA